MPDETLNIYQRLAAAMRECSYIQNEFKVGMNYRIVSHDAVTAKVRPVLLKHGIVYHPADLAYAHNGNRAECRMVVRFVNVDDPTDIFEVPTFGYGVDSQDKGPGKAMSYAVKYALLKAMGLETGEDADNESVDHITDNQMATDKEATRLIANINTCATLEELAGMWPEIPRPMQERDDVLRAKDTRKADLLREQKDAA